MGKKKKAKEETKQEVDEDYVSGLSDIEQQEPDASEALEFIRKCENPNCYKQANLQCPICVKWKLPPSFFCSKECFKDAFYLHNFYHA